MLFGFNIKISYLRHSFSFTAINLAGYFLNIQPGLINIKLRIKFERFTIMKNDSFLEVSFILYYETENECPVFATF